MRAIFDRELQRLHDDVLRLGGMVEDALNRTMVALREMNTAMAEEIIRQDDAIDEMDARIEKHCLSLFAMQSPVAQDMRVVGSSLKMLTDLERIADHAADISELTIRLAPGRTQTRLPDEVFRMADMARGMLNRSLEAYKNRDLESAKAVCADDDQVDAMFNRIVLDLIGRMKQNPDTMETGIDILFIVKYLERIADHATNIAEWVAYVQTGRHSHMQHPENHPGRVAEGGGTNG